MLYSQVNIKAISICIISLEANVQNNVLASCFIIDDDSFPATLFYKEKYNNINYKKNRTERRTDLKEIQEQRFFFFLSG